MKTPKNSPGPSPGKQEIRYRRKIASSSRIIVWSLTEDHAKLPKALCSLRVLLESLSNSSMNADPTVKRRTKAAQDENVGRTKPARVNDQNDACIGNHSGHDRKCNNLTKKTCVPMREDMPRSSPKLDEFQTNTRCAT